MKFVLLLLGLVVAHGAETNWKCVGDALESSQSSYAKKDEGGVATNLKTALNCLPDREGTYNLVLDTKNKYLSAEYVKHKAGVKDYAKVRYSYLTYTSDDCDVLDKKVEGKAIVYTGTDTVLKSIPVDSWSTKFKFEGHYTPVFGANTTDSIPNGLLAVVNATITDIPRIASHESIRLILADEVKMKTGRLFVVRTVIHYFPVEGEVMKVYEYGHETSGCVQCNTEEIKGFLNW